MQLGWVLHRLRLKIAAMGVFGACSTSVGVALLILAAPRDHSQESLRFWLGTDLLVGGTVGILTAAIAYFFILRPRGG